MEVFMSAVAFNCRLFGLIGFLAFCPPEHVSVRFLGTGEGEYRAGLFLSLAPWGGVRSATGFDISDVALRNLLRGGVCDEDEVFYVRVYVLAEEQTSLATLVQVLCKIDQLADPKKDTVVILYFNALRRKGPH
jgi:hypothetical protein